MKHRENSGDGGGAPIAPSPPSSPSSSHKKKKKSKKGKSRRREAGADDEEEGPTKRREAKGDDGEGHTPSESSKDGRRPEGGADGGGVRGGSAGGGRRKRRRRQLQRGSGGVRCADGGADAPPLRGITVSVSTVDRDAPRPQRSDDVGLHPGPGPGPNSYKSVCNECRDLGATVSAQVHRRVSYVVCNASALRPVPTQRIRRAVKLGLGGVVDVVDVAWIRECAARGGLVDASPHLRNEAAREAAAAAAAAKAAATASTRRVDDDDGGDEGTGVLVAAVDGGEDAACWSSPVELDCCCVCHENGHDDCEWCRSCSINLAKKRKEGGGGEA